MCDTRCRIPRPCPSAAMKAVGDSRDQEASAAMVSGMWRRFQDLVGVEYPVMQDGMGPSPTTYLAAAVSAAGGLGTVSCPSITNTSEEFLRKGFRGAIEHVASSTDR